MIDKCIVAAHSQVADWAENEGLEQRFQRDEDGVDRCSAYASARVAMHSITYRPICNTHLAAWRKYEPSLLVELTDYVIEEALL